MYVYVIFIFWVICLWPLLHLYSLVGFFTCISSFLHLLRVGTNHQYKVKCANRFWVTFNKMIKFTWLGVSSIFQRGERKKEQAFFNFPDSRKKEKRITSILNVLHRQFIHVLYQMSYYALNWFQENLLKDVLKEEVFSYLFSKMNSNSVKQTIM